MAIQKDPDGQAELKQVVARRLRAARKSAGLSEMDAAEALVHKGITQVSLAESGGRIPPLLDLIKYADLYSTSLDFLSGRINDPIAEEEEHGRSLITRSVGQVIAGCFAKFSSAVAEHAAVCISGHRADRADIREALQFSREAMGALRRVKELNPEYEDLRGGATLENALSRLLALSAGVEARIKDEQTQFDMIDRALQLEEVETRVKQFALALQA